MKVARKPAVLRVGGWEKYYGGGEDKYRLRSEGVHISRSIVYLGGLNRIVNSYVVEKQCRQYVFL